MSGYITGGWEYVIAAYTFTGGALTVYLASLIWRLRAEKRIATVNEEAARLESDALPHGAEVAS